MSHKDRFPALDCYDVRAIIDQFSASQWKTLEIELGGTRLFLSKDALAGPVWEKNSSAAPVAAAASPTVPTPAGSGHAAPSVTPTAERAVGQVVVNAPSLGTFYRSPKPGVAPFIEVGQEVEAETELCLIEVMKLFTTLRAGTKGKVVEILVEDGVMVEHDQPLFVIDTNG